MAGDRVFGEVPGVPEGTTFPSRAAAVAAGVHRNPQGGIVGSRAQGAESIVVSGGYEDDEDYGDLIIYTGHGGNDPATRRQVADQSPDATGNAALVTSSLSGSPVRVIRGRNADSPHAPASGFRYNGLFRVESWWTETGKSGFRVVRYRLVKLTDTPSTAAKAPDTPAPPPGSQAPGRTTTTVQRVVRSSAVAEHVKRLHDHTCQFCGTRLTIRDRGYSEAAHIRPLGRPHGGPDVPENVLCLCPNCHVLFDNGEITIDDDLTVQAPSSVTSLRTRLGHTINTDHLRHHRDHHW